MDQRFASRLTRLGRGLLKPGELLKPGGGVGQVLRQASEVLAQVKQAVPLPGVGKLAEFMPGPAAKGQTAPPVTEVTGFGANPGNLRMLVHLPPAPQRAGAPLLVLLHGCGQDAASFAAACGFVALADRLGAVLLLPEQQAANNQGRCFNWFRAADTNRGAGESASVRQMVAQAVRQYGSDPSRVFVAGLSAGGAMAAALLAAYPDAFAGGAVVAGLPVGVAHDVASAMTRMVQPPAEPRAALAAHVPAPPPGARWPRLSVWHGAADHTVSPGNSDALVAQWTALLDLPAEPDSDARPKPGLRRRAWGNAVEQWTVAGMGHGFPIEAQHSSEPFVLPAPVQAADAIARFWGLAPG